MAAWNLTVPALETYLNVFAPPSSFPELVRLPCSVDPSPSCYVEPSVVNHLSSQTWLGTLRLLFLCTIVQAAIMALALIWDVVRKVVRGKAAEAMMGKDSYGWLQGSFDFLMIIMNIACCATFVTRSYASELNPMSQQLRLIVNVIDVAGSLVFLAGYVKHGYEALSKWHFVTSVSAILDVLSIVSALAVVLQDALWLPFTFVRPLTMSISLHRIVAVIDMPEITEQLAVSIVDFFSLVFTFAGIFFMLENLGNIPLQTPRQEKAFNFSLFDAVWYVLVSVSTVGYGDVSPKSIMGQLTGGALILVGVLFFGSKTAEISAIYDKVRQGFGRYSLGSGRGRQGQQGHVVVTGSVNQILLRDFVTEFYAKDHAEAAAYGRPICVLGARLVDSAQLISQGLLPPNKVESLCGSLPRDLHRIRPETAQAFFFFPVTRSHRSAVEEDRDTLLRALASKRLSPAADMYLGLHLAENLSLAGGMTALCINSYKTGLIAKATSCPGVIPLVANLAWSADKKQLARLAGHLPPQYLEGAEREIYTCPVPPDLINQKLGEIVHHVMNFKQQGVLIIGLGGYQNVDPWHQSRVPPQQPAAPNLRFVLFPGKKHVIKEEVLVCIAREDPHKLVHASVDSFFKRRSFYSSRTPKRVNLRFAHAYRPPTLSSSLLVAGHKMGVETREDAGGEGDDGAEGAGWAEGAGRLRMGVQDDDDDDNAHLPDPLLLHPSHQPRCRSGEEETAEGTGGITPYPHALRLQGGERAEGGGLSDKEAGEKRDSMHPPRRKRRIKPLPPFKGRLAAAPAPTREAKAAQAGQAARTPHPPPPPAIPAAGSPGAASALAPQVAVSSTTSPHGVSVSVSARASPVSAQGVLGAAATQLAGDEEGERGVRILTGNKQSGNKQSGNMQSTLTKLGYKMVGEKAKLVSATEQVVSMIHEGTNSAGLLSLAPPMIPDSDSPSTSAPRVNLSKHIVVCGFPPSIREFMSSIRASETVVHSYTGKAPRQPVLFVSEQVVGDDMMQELLDWREALYVLRRPELAHSSLEIANINEAMRVVLLSSAGRGAQERQQQQAGGGGSSMSAIIDDSPVIFAYHFIRKHFPAVLPRTFCDIVENDSEQFLNERDDAVTGLVSRPLNLTKMFAEGRLCAASLSTTLMAHGYFNASILPIAGAIISTKITNDSARAWEETAAEEALQGAQVVQVEVPEKLQNRNFGYVAETLLLENDALALALYRPAEDGRYFTFTNPPLKTIVTHRDYLLVLLASKQQQQQQQQPDAAAASQSSP